MADMNVIDMSVAQNLLREIDDVLDELDGDPPNIDQDNNKARMQASARRSRRILYAGHLCDKLKVAINDQYYTFRGEQ